MDLQIKFVRGKILSFKRKAILLKKRLKVLAEGREFNLIFDVDFPGNIVFMADQKFFGLLAFSFKIFLW